MKTMLGDDIDVQEYLGDDNVQGIPTFKFALNRKNMSHEMQIWLAPSLGCELVQQTVQMRSAAGVPEGTSSKMLEKMINGEPDPALFIVPKNYSEVPPSELHYRIMEKMTGSRTAHGRADSHPGLEAEDRKYYARRP